MSNTKSSTTFNFPTALRDAAAHTGFGWHYADYWGVSGLPRLDDGSKPMGDYAKEDGRRHDFSGAVSILADGETGDVTLTITHLDENVDDDNEERWRLLGGDIFIWAGSDAYPLDEMTKDELDPEFLHLIHPEHIAVKSFVYQGTVFYVALIGFED